MIFALMMMLGWALAAPDEGTAATPAATPAAATPAAATPAAAPPGETPAEVATEEIIVWGERLGAARSQLDVDLRHYGYHLKKQKDGWSTYGRSGKDRWKPRVKVDADGLMVFDDPRVVLYPPGLAGKASNAAEEPSHLADNPFDEPDRGNLSLAFPVQVPKRKLQDQEKARVMAAVGPSLAKLQEAKIGEAEANLLATLPDTLDALWRDGRDPNGGAALTDPADRRAALVALWATRADTRAGRAAREAIRTYLAEEVQASATPFTEAERTAAAAQGLAIP